MIKEKLCPQLKLKLEEIKSLKKEFDLEMGKIRETRNTERAKELQEQIEDIRDYIEKIADPNNIKRRGKIGDIYNAKFVSEFHQGVAIVELKNGKEFLINKQGIAITGNATTIKFVGKNRLIILEEEIDPDRNIAMSADYNCRLINEKGETVAPFQYRNLGEFHEGFAIVKKSDSEFFFMDENGKLLNKESFRAAFDFSEGVAAVRRDVGDECRYHYIDNHNKLAIRESYFYATPFSEGLAIVQGIDKKNLYFIDHDGNPFLNEFDCVWPFSCGLARARLNGKQFFIDKAGQRITEVEFNDAGDFREGFASVKDENGWFFIDVSGKPITDKRFESVFGFNEGFGTVFLEDGKRNYISRDGNFFTKESLREGSLGELSEGLAPVRMNDGRNFYLDAEGNHYLEGMYRDIYSFRRGLAVVNLGNLSKNIHINRKGKIIFRD